MLRFGDAGLSGQVADRAGGRGSDADVHADADSGIRLHADDHSRHTYGNTRGIANPDPGGREFACDADSDSSRVDADARRVPDTDAGDLSDLDARRDAGFAHGDASHLTHADRARW